MIEKQPKPLDNYETARIGKPSLADTSLYTPQHSSRLNSSTLQVFSQVSKMKELNSSVEILNSPGKKELKGIRFYSFIQIVLEAKSITISSEFQLKKPQRLYDKSSYQGIKQLTKCGATTRSSTTSNNRINSKFTLYLLLQS